jgi:hypothetical protein
VSAPAPVCELVSNCFSDHLLEDLLVERQVGDEALHQSARLTERRPGSVVIGSLQGRLCSSREAVGGSSSQELLGTPHGHRDKLAGNQRRALGIVSLRRRRARATTPAAPVPNSSRVAGSGTGAATPSRVNARSVVTTAGTPNTD